MSKGTITTTIRSLYTAYEKTVTLHVVQTISSLVPDQPIDRRKLNIPKNLKLADPNFDRPARIDMLLAAGLTLSLFCNGQIDLSEPNGPELYLQKTLFGWIIGGIVPVCDSPAVSKCYVTSLDSNLTKFRTVEEGPAAKYLTDEEQFCEEHFTKHVSRMSDGRYMVALPTTEKIKTLGESKSMALKRFLSNERKLARKPELKRQYHEVMEEYIELGHMSLTENEEEEEGTIYYYLPHRAVIKESSLTTAVRVVFDGSAKTTTGVSLNDALPVGPTVQPDLFTQLLKFRKHPIVLTGDIQKMYRQFYVRPKDRQYLRIFWFDRDGNVRIYNLNIVVFGLTCSPFLAIRCLFQLASDEENDFPEAAKMLKEIMYVDNAILGFKTVEAAAKGQKELTEVLRRGGMHIYQWASNVPALLSDIPTENINDHFRFHDSPTLNTLGIQWNSTNDVITYIVKLPDAPNKVTKRSILSEIARIFDPLGLLAPVIITAKILIQKLWKLQVTRDESLPLSVHSYWQDFRNQLELLNDLNFSRQTLIDEPSKIELHGFCDASEQAYGACVYLRSENSQNQVQVSLLCAKSRVAPVRSISIPRLELCGAVLLAKLSFFIQNHIDIQFNNVTLWSDSTTVLSWLKTPPASLQVFVANRVSEIQSKTENCNWRYVPTYDNPADLLSRGQTPRAFLKPSIWQHGPARLGKSENHWPSLAIPYEPDNLPEMKKIQCFKSNKVDNSLFERFSSFSKLQRIAAYCLRVKNPQEQHSTNLTVTELATAQRTIIRRIQETTFPQELHNLSSGKPVDANSRLLTLNPFLDNEGLIRVGGQLRNSFFPFHQRHPTILPNSHPVTRLLIQEEHRVHAHPGTQATLYALRRRFWVCNGRNAVKKILKSYVWCARHRPPSQGYLMGNLPASRVTPARPFNRVGVDYCGPFFIKEKKYRNRGQIKAYVSVFVCLVTIAVHLELVTELTSDSFLAAFRRFIARRGLCTEAFSNNATNFVGGKNQLQDLFNLVASTEHQNPVNGFAANHNIKWHFIPPRSPNFGGLWEAAVKSFKRHLYHVIEKHFLPMKKFLLLSPK